MDGRRRAGDPRSAPDRVHGLDRLARAAGRASAGPGNRPPLRAGAGCRPGRAGAHADRRARPADRRRRTRGAARRRRVVLRRRLARP